MARNLAPPHDALQHEPAPRPLPLFLELVRSAALHHPETARKALEGLKVYQVAPRHAAQQNRSIVARAGCSTLRDCGGSGRPIVLVPSIINPPNVLDLDPGVSLASALTGSGHVLLLDWGPSSARAALDLRDHVRQLLVPLLHQLGEPSLLVGYCLGGTMALAAASLAPVLGVATLASPWRFSAYPAQARGSLASLWKHSQTVAHQLGALPIEVLQGAFWSLDPLRVVEKYARLAELSSDLDEVRRFVALEDWANGGEPLPVPAARELLVDLFERDLAGEGQWMARLPACPTLHFTATDDRIVPAATVASGRRVSCPAGHVGMVVGRSASRHLHRPLREWLAAHAQQG